MHRSTPLRRSTSCLAIGISITIAAAACTSGSGTAKSTSLASVAPVASSGAVSGASGSAPVSVDVAADVFSCPSAAEINSLTAMTFTAAVGNGSDHCEYVVATGSTQAVRVTIDHPPATATSAGQTLAQFRAAVIAAGNVVLTTAPQYSADAFIARFGTLSCSVFALARDGEVMQVQASHQTPVPTDDCAIAQSVTAVAGTSSRAGTAPASGAPVSTAPVSSAPVSSAPVSGAPAQSTPVEPSPTPTATTPKNPTTKAPTTKRPTAPSSTSEVLIFSTGPVPAASFTLPAPRPTLRTTATTR